MNVKIIWQAAKQYIAGTKISLGTLAFYDSNDELYLGVGDRKNIKIMHSQSEEIVNRFLDGGSAATVYDSTTRTIDGGNA
jgi:hypothetical protein